MQLHTAEDEGKKTVFTWSKYENTVIPRNAVRQVDETEGNGKFRQKGEWGLKEWIYTGSDD